jgi:hypothetical protein
MADRCSFCGSAAGPFSRVEGLFTVLMCADCQAARGHGSGSYPVMTRAELRAGLDELPTWVLEQKGGRHRHVITIMRTRLAAGEQVARMHQEPGLAGWSAKPRWPRTLAPSARGQRSADVVVAHDGRCCVKASWVSSWPAEIGHRSWLGVRIRPLVTVVVRWGPMACGPRVAPQLWRRDPRWAAPPHKPGAVSCEPRGSDAAAARSATAAGCAPGRRGGPRPATAPRQPAG